MSVADLTPQILGFDAAENVAFLQWRQEDDPKRGVVQELLVMVVSRDGEEQLRSSLGHFRDEDGGALELGLTRARIRATNAWLRLAGFRATGRAGSRRAPEAIRLDESTTRLTYDTQCGEAVAPWPSAEAPPVSSLLAWGASASGGRAAALVMLAAPPESSPLAGDFVLLQGPRPKCP